MKMEEVNRMLDEINEDRTVPRNIRNLIIQAREALNTKQEIAVRISTAIAILDDVSNDSNIPIYTRTQIWNVVSLLEIMNEEAKA